MNKTIGKEYLLTPQNGYKRGWYHFAKYQECRTCHSNNQIFLDSYEAVEFVCRARPGVERKSLLARLWSKVPKFRLVVEKGTELDRKLTKEYT